MFSCMANFVSLDKDERYRSLFVLAYCDKKCCCSSIMILQRRVLVTTLKMKTDIFVLWSFKII